MDLQVAHFPVHTRAQADEVIAQALEIAGEHQSDDVHPSIIFREACRLLGARHTQAITGSPAIGADLAGLLRRGSHTG